MSLRLSYWSVAVHEPKILCNNTEERPVPAPSSRTEEVLARVGLTKGVNVGRGK